MMLNRGFSYIELLVVISAMGILAGLGMATYPGVQKTARDSQRRSDLKQYQTSLETYANSHGGFYPSRTTAVEASDVNGGTNLCSDLSLSNCAADVKNGKADCNPPANCSYKYLSNGSGGGTINASKYLLFSSLEKENLYFVICNNGMSFTQFTSPQVTDCP